MTSDSEVEFEKFVRDVEPRLRRALVARYGPDRGREATVDALAWAWEHRTQLETVSSPVPQPLPGRAEHDSARHDP
jgi:DNA-directed RNA polymerase specialized sigma24 family protein